MLGALAAAVLGGRSSPARPPGAAWESWLPAPPGRFRVIVRLDEPRIPALNGPWRSPAPRGSLTATGLGTLGVLYR